MKIIFTIFWRLIGFPFFATLSLIGAIRLWLFYIYNYTVYGGEAIVFDKTINPINIKKVFHQNSNLINLITKDYISSSIKENDDEE